MKTMSLLKSLVPLLILAQAAAAAPGTTVNVNFSLTGAGDTMDGQAFISDSWQQAPAYYPGSTWNDETGPTVIATATEPSSSFTRVNALDSTGAATTIGYTTASTTTPFDLEGPYSFSDHPNVRMLSGGVRRVWNSGSGNALQNRLTITGLDPLKEYNIYIASSQTPGVKCSWQIGAAGPAKAIRNTATVMASQTWRPGDNWVVFSTVEPDAAGTISVYGKGEAGSDAGAFSGITLNGFQIIEATGWLSPDKAIYDFGDPANNPGTRSVISANNTGDSITWTVLYSANLAALSPSFTLADDASCSPPSGTTVNFTAGPVDYTVTAADGSVKVYHVTAVKAPASTATELLAITAGSASAAVQGTVATLFVPLGTPVDALTPQITVSPFATVSPASGVTQDFTNPVSYTVTAEDGVTRRVFTVRVLPANNWINAGGGNWSDGSGTNWDPAVLPVSGFTAALVFNTPGTYTSNQDLGSGFQLNQLVIGAPDLTLTGSSLTFAGVSPQLLMGSAQALKVNADLLLDEDTVLAGAGRGQVSLTGNISGAGHLTKATAGTLLLGGTSTWDGGTTILSGTIKPNRVGCFGTGQVSLAGGVIFNQSAENGTGFEGNSEGGAYPNPFHLSGGPVTFNVAFGGATDIWTNTEISGPGSIVVTGGGRDQGLTLKGVNTFSGGVTIAGPDTPNVSLFNHTGLGTGTLSTTMTSTDLTRGGLRIQDDFTAPAPNAINLPAGTRLVVNTEPGGTAPHYAAFSGVVSGPGSLVKAGNGTLELTTTANTYTGLTRVNGGVLKVSSANSLGSGPLRIKPAAPATTAVVDLNFSGVRTISALTINDDVMADGTYGSSTSVPAPDHVDDEHFAGTGLIRVGPVIDAYQAWAESFGLTGASAAADVDFDKDGLANGIEFVTGTSPSAISPAPLRCEVTGNSVAFIFERAVASKGTNASVAIEVSSSLTAWPDSYPVPDATAAPMQVTANGATETIRLTLPMGPNKLLFGRLNVRVVR